MSRHYQENRVAALVIGVLSVATPTVWADATSAPMLSWHGQPQYYPSSSIWNGGSWSGAQAAQSIDEMSAWVVLRNCPTRPEFVMGTLDYSSDVNVQSYTGGAWNSPTEICANAGGNTTRAFDLAYEQNSGDLLVAYWSSDGSGSLCYRSNYGSGFSAPGTLSLPASDRVKWVRLVPKGGTDDIFLLCLNEARTLFAARWDGSGFGLTVTLAGNCSSSATECFDFVWESLSGEGLAVYAATGNQQPLYRTWNGAVWSGEGSLPSVGANPRWLRLAADPTSNQILFGSLDDVKRVNANVWNGASWGSNQGLGTNACWNQMRAFDIAYEGGGTRALIAYPESWDSRLRYRVWNGSSWSDGSWGPDCGQTPTLVQLVTGVNPGEVLAAIQDDGEDLNALLWNGSSFSLSQQVEATLSIWGREGFMVGGPAAAAMLFTDVSAATGFSVQTSGGADFGSGLHWGDLDNDGDLDAVITGNQYSRLLLNNLAAGSFAVSNFGGGSVHRQGALLDIDNDGDLDFLGIPSDDDQHLYRNNGSATFIDAGSIGLAGPAGNEGLAAADVNGDGWCDAVMFSGNANWIGHHQAAQTPQFVGTTSPSYGLNALGGYGDGDYCSAGDVNNDGYLDFFYHYDGGKLFLSNGDGTFSRNNHGISISTGANEKIGSAWADYDNDGDLDLFVPGYAAGQAGYLWRNDLDWSTTPPAGSFTNVAVAAGVTDTSGQRSCCWGDYDNDRDLDLYIVTRGGAANVLYQNQGPPNWNFAAVNVGAAALGNGHDAAFVDYDNDGDLDLAVTQQGSANTFLRNGTNDANYLKVRLLGHGAGGTNRAAIGTRVEIWNAAGTTLLARRDVGCARGFGGTEPLWLHFGGLNNSKTYTVKVFWTGHPATEAHRNTVIPVLASTTIGGTTIPQMLTVQEPSSIKIIHWREKPNRNGD